MIVVGDCLQVLSAMPAESVHCCITSPPYWGLRSYQGDPGMIGLEPTLEEHIERLVEVFREVRRVLRSDGTLWLNYGDAYAGNAPGARDVDRWPKQGGRRLSDGKKMDRAFKPKNLMMMPARVALALQSDGSDKAASDAIGRAIWDIVDDYGYDNPPPDRVLAILERLEAEYREAHGDGWNLHSEIVWHKPNPMPESVIARPTSSHEKLFLLSKSGRPTHWLHEDGRGSRTKPEPDYRWITDEDTGESKRRNMWRGRDYFYDAEAVRVDAIDTNRATFRGGDNGYVHSATPKDKGLEREAAITANLRNVWKIPVHAYKGAHFATFPPALVEPCIKAGTSQHGVCSACGAPWVRQVDKVLADGTERDGGERNLDRNDFDKVRMGDGAGGKTTGWHPSCTCEADLKPAIVLDPFSGAGTVALVAQRLGRKALCIEIAPEYALMAQQRVERDLPVTRRPNREKPGEFQLELMS